jgi:hypothetical protein
MVILSYGMGYDNLCSGRIALLLGASGTGTAVAETRDWQMQ